MNQMFQILIQNKLQQIPRQMMTRLEQQLKMVSPEAFQRYQEAKQNNEDPNKLLNETINGFNPQQRQQWDNMVGQYSPQQNINTK